MVARRSRRPLPALYGFALAAAIGACAPVAPPPERLSLDEARFSDLPGWGDDHQAEALKAFLLSCPPLVQSGATALGPESNGFGAKADWQAACDEGHTIAGDDAPARAFFERRFTPYLAGNNRESLGLFTGYYVPELHGSRKQAARYQTPIYRTPDDLVTADLGLFREDLKGVRIAGKVEDGKLRPYAARAEIDKGALSGRSLEIVYVDDAVDAFFLHIQGSGRVVLDDGYTMNIGYAGSNGRPYVAIGRELVARGAMAKEDVTMQAIRDWLAAHPGEAEKTMEANPSYVFFHVIEGPAPIGAEGVVLTPGRSLAVDHRFLPYGVPVWLETKPSLSQYRPIQRLLVAQDTGGAITGPVRGDVFWGFGPKAAELAGPMKDPGRYFLLLPKGGLSAAN